MKLKINGEVKLTLADIEVELIEDDLDELDDELDLDEEFDELEEELEDDDEEIIKTVIIKGDDKEKREDFIKLGKLLGIISDDIDKSGCSCVKAVGEESVALAKLFVEFGKRMGVLKEADA